jgi:CBS domain-containing protein
MTNRSLLTIVKDQHPLILDHMQTIQCACLAMCQRRTGSVLVVDDHDRLCGIFTGRDALRVLASGTGDGCSLPLSAAMTRAPVTIEPTARAIDALRVMSDGGFRHVPVVEGGRIWGIVSRTDFLGTEIERLDEEEQLAQCIW